jgi:microcystin-dependent protein
VAAVTGFTAARMLQIENETIVNGFVDLDGNLILQTRAGQVVNAGYVHGEDGAPGQDAHLLAGVVQMYGGSTPPPGHYLCNGAEASRTDDAALFAVIGTTYGAGNGSTTFNLPDFRGRSPFGFDPSQTDFNALGKMGGSLTHRHLTTMGYDGNNLYLVNSNGSQSLEGVPTESIVTTISRATVSPAAAASSSARLARTQPGSSMAPFTTLNFIISRGPALPAGGTPVTLQEIGGRGTPAERDALFGVPATVLEQEALARQRVVWYNTANGRMESYFARRSAGLGIKGVPTNSPVGWYPISGDLPQYDGHAFPQDSVPQSTWTGPSLISGDLLSNDGFIVTTDGLIYVPVAGKYRVTGVISWVGSTAGNMRGVRVYAAGSRIWQNSPRASGWSSSSSNINFSTKVAVNDPATPITLQIYHDTGAALVGGVAALSIEYVGPWLLTV